MNEVIMALIIGLIVGVIPSMLVLLIREKKIEPDKWKKDTQWKELTRKLEVHGELKTMLDSAHQRNTRQKKEEESNEYAHCLIIPEDYDLFKRTFGKYRHLLSKELTDMYLDFIKKDEYFSDVSSKEVKLEGMINRSGDRYKVDLKNKKSRLIFCDLIKMEETVKKEYDSLKDKYYKFLE